MLSICIYVTGEAAYHVILELYDRGNIVLADYEYKILNILRPRVQGEEKFLVRETYPVELAKTAVDPMTEDKLQDLLQPEITQNEAEKRKKKARNDTLKKILVPHFEYGPALLEHRLLEAGLTANMKIGKDFRMDPDLTEKVLRVMNSPLEAEKSEILGLIVQKADNKQENEELLLTYLEFHPMMLRQIREKPQVKFESFDQAVDEFFSKIESQKIDLAALQQEKQALKKLDNVKKDHEVRLEKLQKEQKLDRRRAELVEMNQELVEQALMVLRSAIANQMDWTEIENVVEEAKANNDPVASRIKGTTISFN